MAEEGLPQSVLQKPLDENNCISREILIHYFPDALGFCIVISLLEIMDAPIPTIGLGISLHLNTVSRFAQDNVFF
jgi:hypothetical protein